MDGAARWCGADKEALSSGNMPNYAIAEGARFLSHRRLGRGPLSGVGKNPCLACKGGGGSNPPCSTPGR
jgi:hypothetical protein